MKRGNAGDLPREDEVGDVTVPPPIYALLHELVNKMVVDDAFSWDDVTNFMKASSPLYALMQQLPASVFDRMFRDQCIERFGLAADQVVLLEKTRESLLDPAYVPDAPMTKEAYHERIRELDIARTFWMRCFSLLSLQDRFMATCALATMVKDSVKNSIMTRPSPTIDNVARVRRADGSIDHCQVNSTRHVQRVRYCVGAPSMAVYDIHCDDERAYILIYAILGARGHWKSGHVLSPMTIANATDEEVPRASLFYQSRFMESTDHVDYVSERIIGEFPEGTLCVPHPFHDKLKSYYPRNMDFRVARLAPSPADFLQTRALGDAARRLPNGVKLRPTLWDHPCDHIVYLPAAPYEVSLTSQLDVDSKKKETNLESKLLVTDTFRVLEAVNMTPGTTLSFTAEREISVPVMLTTFSYQGRTTTDSGAPSPDEMKKAFGKRLPLALIGDAAWLDAIHITPVPGAPRGQQAIDEQDIRRCLLHTMDMLRLLMDDAEPSRLHDVMFFTMKRGMTNTSKLNVLTLPGLTVARERLATAPVTETANMPRIINWKARAVPLACCVCGTDDVVAVSVEHGTGFCAHHANA